MFEPKLDSVLRHVRHVLERTQPDRAGDRQLLESFLAAREETAFAALVRRHGPMVFGVCRRVLSDWHDAEDAFQATFLVLARRAKAVRRRESVGSWLYGVAYRVAAKAKAGAARRRFHERRREPVPPEAPSAWQDLRPLLDDELARLPEKYRAPLVLCYLEGLTRDEAARQLGWAPGALKGRLERGRNLLRRRLSRRGLAFSTALLATALTATTSAAAVTPPLLAITVKAAVHGSAAGAMSAPVAALSEGVLRTMTMTRWTVTTALVFALGTLGAGTGVIALQALPEKPEADPPPAAQRLFNFAPPAVPKPQGDEKLLQGTWVGVAGERDGKPIPVEEAAKLRLTVQGRRITFFPSESETIPFTFTLDVREQPKLITMTPAGEQSEPIPGIYALEGDRLWVCVDNVKGKVRPTDFATKPGSGLILFVLDREKPGRKQEAPKENQTGKRSNALADRVQSVNNLKQIGLALHNYHDAYGHLPPAAVYDKNGKPLLSWRVLLLPFLEQDNLYKQFKLDEPWDGPNNKKLLAQMPKVYAPVAGKTGGKYETFYQVFHGPGAVFDGEKPLRFADITDGTSNTILLAEAGETVPWTKPTDLPFAADKPLPALGGMFTGGFHVLIADGSVHYLKLPVDAKTLRPFITRAGGEAVDIKDLKP